MPRFQFIAFLVSTALCHGVFAAAVPADESKLARVASGELGEACASWWGYDSEDSTAQLEAALASGVSRLILDRQDGSWITAKTLRLPSGFQLILEEGVTLEAKRGAFRKRAENLLEMKNGANITVRGLGKGATVKMHKEDYVSKDYQWSTHRHCIAIYGCDNVVIENLVSRDSGGDGIYLADGKNAHNPHNILIRNVTCDNNYRQGISVICGVNVILENLKLINTADTPPSAGIDFEPNNPDVEHIYHVIMRDCLMENNKGCGLDLYLNAMSAKSGPIGITFENCICRGNAKPELKLVINNTDLKRMDGCLTFRNCRFEDNASPLMLNGTSCSGPRITFENVSLRNIAEPLKAEAAPITAVMQPKDDGTAGNVHFRNVTVFDAVERAPFTLKCGNIGMGGLEAISGSITADVKGKKTTYIYDDAWAAKMYPKRDYTPVPHVQLQLDRIAPLHEDASVTTTWKSMRMRDGGRWLIYARAGQDLDFRTSVELYSKTKPCRMVIRLLAPDGRMLWTETVTEASEKDRHVKSLPATGIYRLLFKGAGSCCGVTSCNRPIVMDLNEGEQNFMAGGGFGYLQAPEDTDVAIRFSGEGNEGLGAEVFAPDGSRVFASAGFILPEEVQLLRGKAMPGTYKVIVKPPVGVRFFEDHFLNVFGIPALLAPVPEYVFVTKQP